MMVILSILPHVRQRHLRFASKEMAAVLGGGLSRIGESKLPHCRQTWACKTGDGFLHSVILTF